MSPSPRPAAAGRPTARKAAANKAAAATATRLLLVRHGTTATTGSVLPGRARGLALSEKGLAEAEAVAARIAPLQPVAVYASPLERTRQTAAPIGRAAGVRVRTAKGLLECDFGEWTGAKLSALRKLPEWRTVQSAPSVFRFPGGESFAEMSQRMWDQLLALAAAHRGGTVVAVSHADPIKAALATAAGSPLDSFQRIVVSPCSVSVVLLGAAPPLVLAMNSTGDDLGGLVPS